MATEPKDKEIVVDDEGVVTVDLSDSPELVEALGDVEEQDEVVVEEKKPEPKPKATPRVRLSEQQAVSPPAVDEATKALTAARDAANATAASERQRREAAERAVIAARQEADDARASAESTQITLLDNGIEAATREVAAHEAQLATAFEAGDFKGAASIQTKLSKATSTLDRLESQKADIEANPKSKTTEGRVVDQPSGSLFEQYVSQYPPDSQSWLRSHPECIPAAYGGNATANAKMMKGHYAALEQNIPPNTPEYFRVIEENTGHRQPVSKAAEVVEAGAEEAEVRPAPKPKPRAQPSAPPSREPPTAQGLPRAQRTVTLTKDQQEMAKISFPQLPINQAFAQYARNLLELEAEGKLGRLTH